MAAKERDNGYFVHPSSVVEPDAKIGKGTKIWHFSHVSRGAEVGEGCVLGQNTFIGPEVKIGRGCKIQNNVSVYKSVTLEDDVFCGPSCVFTNVYNPRAFIERKDEFRETVVRRGATIGANATIICGVRIGSFALVGAGAVVREDVKDYSVVVGVPARWIGWVCRCGVRLEERDGGKMRCPACGIEYMPDGEMLKIAKE